MGGDDDFPHRHEILGLEPVNGGDDGPLVDVTEADLTVDQRALVAALRGRGQPARRSGLPMVARWRRERFEAVRSSLIDAGWLESDRYGTMRLTPTDQRRRPDVLMSRLANEQDLEPYARRIVAAVAKSRFAAADGCYQVVDTARAGAARTGGKWTRPDVSLVTIEADRWIPDVVVSTFEIKLGTRLLVDAVHEALAQRARAHAAWIMADSRCRDDAVNFERIAREAMSYGIGIIVITHLPETGEDAEEGAHYDIVVEPTFHKPNTDSLNHFVSSQFPAATRAWLRQTLERLVAEPVAEP